jgi:hypothetical protein
MEGYIDNLIDQVDQNSIPKICNKCSCSTKHLLKESCGHYICIQCAESLILKDVYNNCTVCNTQLVKNIYRLYTEYFENPINRLSYHYGINTGDMVWCYQGQGHNWLYCKEQSDYLEEQFQKIEKSGCNSESLKIPIQIEINGSKQDYIVDFAKLKQYPKNMPSKSRNISCFKLKNVSDLKKNKIIGVGGRVL